MNKIEGAYETDGMDGTESRSHGMDEWKKWD